MTSSPAALLLDPKSYKRQNAAGNTLFPDANNSFHKILEHAPHSSYKPSPSLNLRGTSEPLVDSVQPSFTFTSASSSSTPSSPNNLYTGSMDHFISLEGQNAYTSFKGRPPGRNYGTSPESSVGGAPMGTTFDPRQLLNPGSFRSTNRPRHVNTSPARNPDALGWTNTKKDESLDPNSKRGLNQFAREGQVNMIEDMYGVMRREIQPQKRIKVDSAESQGCNGGTQFSGSGNRFIGEYMKEDSDKTSQPTAVADTIDLTLGEYPHIPILCALLSCGQYSRLFR